MFGQTFALDDLATVGVLIVLEGLLSLDNVLVLGILAQRVDKSQRVRALSFGLLGALLLRLAMVAAAAILMEWNSLKVLGGIYLLWVGTRHFIFGKSPGSAAQARAAGSGDAAGSAGFWPTVLAIEFTDLSFAVDSILAAVALVGPPPAGVIGIHPKLWVIITGGMIGVVLMRFAAALVMRLMDRFPGLNRAAYMMVILIGLKLACDWAFELDFQDMGGAAFWIFWSAMALCLLSGLIPPKRSLRIADVKS